RGPVVRGDADGEAHAPTRGTKMRVWTRFLMAGVGVFFLSGDSPAGPISLTPGTPTQAGGISLRLVAPDGTGQKFTAAILKTDNATQKAIKIQLAVAGVAGWDAVRDGDKLTFKHKEGDAFKDVEKIRDINDKTGEKETIAALGLGGRFDLGLDGTVVAAG